MMSGRRSNRLEIPRSSPTEDELDRNDTDRSRNSRKSSRNPPPTQNPDAVMSNITVESTLSGGSISHGGNSRSQHVAAESSKINGKSNGSKEPINGSNGLGQRSKMKPNEVSRSNGRCGCISSPLVLSTCLVATARRATMARWKLWPGQYFALS